jgi:hypothetical protein
MKQISHATTTETGVAENNSPQVGIFWMISVTAGARLLASSCTLDKAEAYGDCLTYGPGHYQIWQGWRRSRELDAAERAVVRAYEYEDWPRGRIVFNLAQDRFILYSDRKLMRPETIEAIRHRFKLPAERVAIESDFHYQSRETPKLEE